MKMMKMQCNYNCLKWRFKLLKTGFSLQGISDIIGLSASKVEELSKQ